jgi:hypothetical protein
MEYGSDLLGLEGVKLMTLNERGLLATMRWHLWANDTLPADPQLMARLLGLEAAEVQAALTDRVMSFFSPVKGDSTRLICPELAAQMERLMERREKMVQGAHNSHNARKDKEKAEIATHGGTHDATHHGSGVASELQRTAANRTALGRESDKRKPSRGGNGGEPVDDPFVQAIDATDKRERVLKANRGGT